MPNRRQWGFTPPHCIQAVFQGRENPSGSRAFPLLLRLRSSGVHRGLCKKDPSISGTCPEPSSQRGQDFWSPSLPTPKSKFVRWARKNIRGIHAGRPEGPSDTARPEPSDPPTHPPHLTSRTISEPTGEHSAGHQGRPEGVLRREALVSWSGAGSSMGRGDGAWSLAGMLGVRCRRRAGHGPSLIAAPRD